MDEKLLEVEKIYKEIAEDDKRLSEDFLSISFETIENLWDRVIMKGVNNMAKNQPYGDNRRQGAVRDRSQTCNPHNDRFTKRDTETGRFIDQKADKQPFKGVRKEK